MTSRDRSSRVAFTLIELLVVIGVIAVLIGLTLAGVQRVREAAARAKCQNNVRQLALALHQYHDAHNALPPGHRSLKNRDRMAFSGWTLSALPFLEQQALFDRASVAYLTDSYPFHNPPHAGLATVVPAFTCPSDGRVSTPQAGTRTGAVVAFTSYLGVAGRDAVTARDGVFYQDSATRFADITDGQSNTLMLGERPPSADFRFGWWYAGVGQVSPVPGQGYTGSADLVLGVREPNLQPIVSGSPCGPGTYPFMAAGGLNDPCGMFHFWSPHPGGANFAFADGSVRFLRYSADPLLPALATRAGDEPAPALD